MKPLAKLAGTLVLALSTFAASGVALAQHHHHHGGGVRFGVYVGAPYYYAPYYPRYYYPPSYYPPVVVAPSAPPVYVEQNSVQGVPAPAPSAAQQSWWYYCAESVVYYPYAKECPAGWQRVAPQPPNG